MPYTRYSACKIAWHRWEQLVVAVRTIVPIASIVQVLPSIVHIPALYRGQYCNTHEHCVASAIVRLSYEKEITPYRMLHPSRDESEDGMVVRVPAMRSRIKGTKMGRSWRKKCEDQNVGWEISRDGHYGAYGFARIQSWPP